MTDQEWIVRGANGKERTASSRSDAEDIKAEVEALGLEAEIIPPETDTAPEPVEAEVVPEGVEPEEYELPDRSVGDDPFEWMPSHFVDEIEGSPAINRKGFEVLSMHYNISVESEIHVPPEENDFEFCRVKATAIDENGRRCEAFGSAWVGRDDDPGVLLEMADTRAKKRALSMATGVGMLAVEELKSEAVNP